jgi:hypothetical protein
LIVPVAFPIAPSLLVVIESPFAGRDAVERAAFRNYLRRCALDSLGRGEAPYASHAMLTQWLDDDVPEQRAQGIEAGLAWGARADLVAVYTDHGVSRGMQLGIDRAVNRGTPVVYREIGK